jgi:hypothetical protein
MTESNESNKSRYALARRHGLIDLGRLPERIRKIAGFWGGSTTGAQAINELVQSNGFTRNVEKLRSEIARVHDARVRKEFLEWLASRTYR